MKESIKKLQLAVHAWECSLHPNIPSAYIKRDELGQRYGARIDSRLAEVLDVINFYTTDLRRE